MLRLSVLGYPNPGLKTAVERAQPLDAPREGRQELGLRQRRIIES